MEDLQSFFKTYYAPNNLTLVLAGDLVPEQVFELARRYFEPIPRQAAAEPESARVSPSRSGSGVVVVRRKAQTPLLQYAYKAPAAADPRGPAVNLLLSILVDGDASRLHRSLVERQADRHRGRRALAGRIRSRPVLALPDTARGSGFARGAAAARCGARRRRRTRA